jgi:heat shock protein HtpX
MDAPAQHTVTRRSSLILWALLALSIVAFSYLVTLLLAFACIALSFFAFRAGLNIQLIALGACGLIIGFTILWSLIPRHDKFEPPGALLVRSCYPRFFAELDRIANSLNEQLPGEVYLVHDVNAWVTERGGVMGFGGRRVMGVGLPLLSVLTISQFRAVLAHEFGHYYGGDTRLGPFVYKSRDGMVRTLKSLGEPSEILRFVARYAIAYLLYKAVVGTMVGYWKLFLRATQMISRRQEYRADELACQLVGSQALIDGLRTIHGADLAVSSYWNHEISPLVGAGFRAPISEGFCRFVAAPQVSKSILEHVDRNLREAKTDPYDSHPPLRDRIAAASKWPGSTQPREDDRASTLLDDLEAAELELLLTLNPNLKQRSLRLLSWDNYTAEFLLPTWKENVAPLAALFAPITTESLPGAIKNLVQIGSQIPDPPGVLLDPRQRAVRAVELLGVALGLVLLDHGWTMFAQPGQFYLKRGDEELNPLSMVAHLADGDITREAWIERCQSLGVFGLPLSKPSADASPETKLPLPA